MNEIPFYVRRGVIRSDIQIGPRHFSEKFRAKEKLENYSKVERDPTVKPKVASHVKEEPFEGLLDYSAEQKRHSRERERERTARDRVFLAEFFHRRAFAARTYARLFSLFRLR